LNESGDPGLDQGNFLAVEGPIQSQLLNLSLDAGELSLASPLKKRLAKAAMFGDRCNK